MNYSVSALIVAPPGRLRSALKVILKAIPMIKSVTTADDFAMALGPAAISPPDVLFVDAAALESYQNTANSLYRPCGGAACIVIIEHEWQRRIAHEIGADVVLIRGFSVDTLCAAMTDALVQQSIWFMAA